MFYSIPVYFGVIGCLGSFGGVKLNDMKPTKGTIIDKSTDANKFKLGQKVWLFGRKYGDYNFAYCRKSRYFGKKRLVHGDDVEFGWNDYPPKEKYTLVKPRRNKRYKVKIEVLSAIQYSVIIFIHTNISYEGKVVYRRIGVAGAGRIIISTIGVDFEYLIKDSGNGVYELKTIHDGDRFTNGKIWLGTNIPDNGDDIYMDGSVDVIIDKNSL